MVVGGVGELRSLHAAGVFGNLEVGVCERLVGRGLLGLGGGCLF